MYTTRYKRLLSFVARNCFILIFICYSTQAIAGGEGRKRQSSAKKEDPVASAIHPLALDIFAALKKKSTPPDDKKLSALLDIFMEDDASSRVLKKYNGASGSYFRSTYKVPLKTILQYHYDPNIPSYLMTPSTLRYSFWKKNSEYLNLEQPLSAFFPAKTPEIIYGQEYEEITPDTNSGAYYGYTNNRMLVLYTYKGRDVLLSVSVQDGKSDVGKKGVVLNDDNWQYFYSGIPGLTSGGAGWMDTFMYSAWSITALMENADGTTTNVVCKWLCAGWININVVNTGHILEGSKRYSAAVSQIFQAKNLPTPEVLAAKVKEISSLPDEELNKKTKQYALGFAKQWGKDKNLQTKAFKPLVADGAYADTLSRKHKISTLLVDYMSRQIKTKQVSVSENTVHDKAP